MKPETKHIELKSVFNKHYLKTKTKFGRDDTMLLLSIKANRKRLEQSIEQLQLGNTIRYS